MYFQQRHYIAHCRLVIKAVTELTPLAGACHSPSAQTRAELIERITDQIYLWSGERIRHNI